MCLTETSTNNCMKNKLSKPIGHILLVLFGLNLCIGAASALEIPADFELGSGGGIEKDNIHPSARGSIEWETVIDYRNLDLRFDNDYVYYSVEIRTVSYVPADSWTCTLELGFEGRPIAGHWTDLPVGDVNVICDKDLQINTWKKIEGKLALKPLRDNIKKGYGFALTLRGTL